MSTVRLSTRRSSGRTPIGQRIGWRGPEARVLADGTVWAAGTEARMADGEPVLDDRGRLTPGDPFLMRFDGTEWQRWGPADGLPTPPTAEGTIRCCDLEQAPGDALWVSYATREDPDGGYRDTVAWWDGSTWLPFLPERSLHSSAVVPDGSLWATTDRGLYVITPEAVAATE